MKNETEVGEGMAGMALFGIALALVGMLMTGCTSSTGWGFQVGVFPVSQVRNVQSLQGNQTDMRVVKRAPAPKTGQTAEDDY